MKLTEILHVSLEAVFFFFQLTIIKKWGKSGQIENEGKDEDVAAGSVSI